jgi:hypothetical protein
MLETPAANVTWGTTSMGDSAGASHPTVRSNWLMGQSGSAPIPSTLVAIQTIDAERNHCTPR